MVSTSWIMNLAVSWAPLLEKRPNMPLSIWRCQTQGGGGGGGWWYIYIYIYMYKLTYINDVCIYLTLFIYWFWFAPCWDLYIWIYFDIRGSIWVCQQWSGEPCSNSFVEWLWVYQNNMEHSLHHSIFQRIFRGLGDPWHNIFFHTATIVIYINIQWHSQKVRIKTCSHLFSTVPQTLCLHNPYVCKAVSYRLIFVFVCLLRFWLSGFLICFILVHIVYRFFKFLMQSCRLMSNGTCMEDVFSGTFKYLVPDISRGPRGPRASANSVGLLSDQNKGEMDWLPTCTASCHMALSTCMVCQWPNYWGFIWKQPGNEFWEMQPTLVYINICQHHFSFIQWLLNRFGTVALPLQSTFVIRFHHSQGNPIMVVEKVEFGAHKSSRPSRAYAQLIKLYVTAGWLNWLVLPVRWWQDSAILRNHGTWNVMGSWVGITIPDMQLRINTSDWNLKPPILFFWYYPSKTYLSL